mmetsp:Transcript_2104/g.6339  ORF Transcript_2104/g.6339 Transcript_2104/m.6339 type:complete len:95 (-) Transcript_2104:666-950(-)
MPRTRSQARAEARAEAGAGPLREDVRHAPPRFVLALPLKDGSRGPEAFVEYEWLEEPAADGAGGTMVRQQPPLVVGTEQRRPQPHRNALALPSL